MTNKCIGYVDGSYNPSLKRYGIGVVMLSSEGDLMDSFCMSGNNELWASSHNITAELFATMKAVEWAINHDYNTIEVRHDLAGTAKWADKLQAANKIPTQAFQLFIDRARERIDISFTKVKAHAGDPWNELADSLAKKSIRGA